MRRKPGWEWLLGCVAVVGLSLGCGGCGEVEQSGEIPAGDNVESQPAEITTVEGLEGLAGTIAIDGSSTVYPVTEAVAEEFQNATKQKVKVTVGISGTGGGFKKFGRGETDISDASRPIVKDEMTAAAGNGIEYLELPVCFDALTVVIHPENDWAETMTVEDLKKIWEPAAEKKILKWSDVRAEWPDEPMALYGPGTDSGTFDYFTEAICGKSKSSRGDFTASEDDNTLVQGVEGNKHALGYFGFAYYEPNKGRLKAVKVVPPGGSEGVMPSEEAVISNTYTPLSRPLFIYVSTKALERPEVGKFVEFYLKNGAALAKEVAYVPLPASAYEKCLERLAKKETGTAFGGEPAVGVPIDELLSRPLVK